MSDFVTDPSFSSPSGGETPVSTPSSATVTPNVPGTGTTPQSVPSQTPATSVPSGYVPSYRVREATERYNAAVQASQAERAEYQRQIAEYERKVQALAGVLPAQTSRADAIKEEFFELFPEAKEIFAQKDAFRQVLARQSEYEALSEHHWSNHASRTVDSLISQAEASIGTQLNDVGRRNLINTFIGYVQSSPEAYSRYQNDPTFVQEYWQTVSSTLIDPARRAATAQMAGRVPGSLPQDTPSGAPQTSPGIQKYASQDDRVSAAWHAFNATRNAGKF